MVSISNHFALLRQFVWRHARLHPLVALLNVGSIALGVAVYLAVQVANHSATRAFRASIDLVSGKSQLEVRPTTGYLDDALLPLVAGHPGVAAATPIVEAYATFTNRPNEHLRLLGIDIFTSTRFQTIGLGKDQATGKETLASRGETAINWLTTPNQVILTDRLASRLGIATGYALGTQVNGRSCVLEVAAVDSAEGLDEAASDRIALMDIGWLQEVADRIGQLDSIQIILEEGAELESVRRSLNAALPPETTVSTPAQRSGQIETMLRGFQLNLTALSMVSILVGFFLIYNTVAASVVRRRKEIGTLRATGASRRFVRGLFLGEAGLYACLGAVVGAPAGIYLSRFLIGQVSDVISSHYLLVHVAQAFADPIHVLGAVGYGLAAALAGAWLPADEAASIPPAEALHPQVTAPTGRLAGARWRTSAGLLALAACAGIALCALHDLLPPPWTFVACFLLMVGFSLLVPDAICLLARPLGIVLRGRVELSLAVDNLTRSLHRNSMTAAALTVAIAMMVGVTIMVRSFRETVDLWMDRSIVADIFIGPSANEKIGMHAFLPREVRSFALSLRGVSSGDTYREIPIGPPGKPCTLSVIDGPARDNLPLIQPSPEVSSGSWQEPGKALVNQPYQRRFGVGKGDIIRLPSPSGEIELEVVGIYHDYADDQGQITISRKTFDAHWNDPRYHSLALFLEPGTDASRITEAIRSRFSPAGELSIYSNRRLRERVFEIFDQTFAVTYALRTVAVAVAVAGIVLTLTTLVRERLREIAILRAIGASRAQVAIGYMTEAGCIGLCSAVLGSICGLCLAIILTHVVNLAFFGWTVRFFIPWAELLPVPLWITAVAAAAGILPARFAAQADPAPPLREL